jgi:diguanylate cyclase (GGDEF)-like protein/PAS domain S-box-containing protein
MIVRKLMPFIVGALIILQVVSAFILTAPIMAVIGCLIVVISAIRWELTGGIISATWCSAVVLLTHMLSILQGSSWVSIVITVLLYYAVGTGIGGTLGKMRKQRSLLESSETRFKSANMELRIEKERLRVTLDYIVDGVIATDVKGNIETISKNASIITGWDVNDAIGRPLIEVLNIVNEGTAESYGDLVAEVLRGGDVSGHEKKAILVSKSGTASKILNRISSIKDAEDNIIGVVVVFNDITKLKNAEDALKQTEEKYKNYIENAPDGIFVTDESGCFIEVNNAATKITGYSNDELIRMKIGDLLPVVSQEAGKHHFNKLLKTGSSKGEMRYRKKDGSTRWWNIDAVKLSEHRYLGFANDITEQKVSEERVISISFHDQLTGLYNRRYYLEELQRIDTRRNLPITIVMGDVNGLKKINDSVGHAVGDKLLKKTAEIIKKGCRTDDIIARLGGDEFVILLPKTDAIKAEQIINRINDLAIKVKVANIAVSISFGYKTKNEEEENIQEIFKCAEDLMYSNKRFECLRMITGGF